MENKEHLSGIERDLVLQYLMDGNVPVTLTPLEKDKSSSESIHSVPSKVFPVAIKGESIKVHKNGKIYLENPNQSVIGFANKTVKVEFYFNRVGLFFISEVKEEKKSLVLLLPEKINRIKDEEDVTEYDFSAQLYFECKNKKDINEKCIPWEHEQLFNRPVWKSIPLENQKLAKDYLEQFVEEAKIEKNAGNGIQLIPICNYLTYEEKKMEAVQDRKKPLSVLYVDHERIVLGNDGQTEYTPGDEYGLKMCFSIKESPVLSRDIFVTCLVNKIYKAKNDKTCIDFIYTTIQEEDIRYLYEKATKKHLI
jgi:hypothetical protein